MNCPKCDNDEIAVQMYVIVNEYPKQKQYFWLHRWPEVGNKTAREMTSTGRKICQKCDYDWNTMRPPDLDSFRDAIRKGIKALVHQTLHHTD